MKKLYFVLLMLVLMVSACQSVAPDDSHSAPDAVPGPDDGDVSSNPLDQPVQDGDTPADAPAMSDFLPRDDDARLQSGPVYVNTADLLILESYPSQFVLVVAGELPDPCHALRMKVGEPQEDGQIAVSLYSVRDPDMMCAAVLQPFDVNIPLGSFPSGMYQVYLNGEKVVEFEGQE
jgi:hypothetical protein